MITILVRCSYRPKGFSRLWESIKNQTYKSVKVICSYDDERALSYIPEECEKIRVHKFDAPFFYDAYVNPLKSAVIYGWFCVIDEDDYIDSPTALQRVSKHLIGNNGVICQFRRGERLKPSNQLIMYRRVIRTKIGMPCLFLHADRKDVAFLDGYQPAADYLWIKEVSKKIPLKFVPIVVVRSDKRGYGLME